MKVRKLDKRGERLELRVDDEEDLWTLRTVLRPGDLVTLRTFRDVSIKGSERKQRKPIIVKLKIKNIEFQPFTGKLRVYGIIIEGPEEYGLKGKHHAAMVTVGQKLILERSGGWSKEVIRRLEESGPRGRAIVVAIDYDEYAMALVAHHGYRLLMEKDVSLPGKDDPRRDEVLENYISSVARNIVDLCKRENTRLVIIVGPGPLKEFVSEKVKELSPEINVNIDSASMGGRAGVEEALRRPKIYQILKEYSIVEAEDWLEEFLSFLAKDRGRVAYAIDDVLTVARLGVIDKLIVVDDLIYTIDDREREKVDEALLESERSKAKILIVPKDSPIGEKLWRLGGIIAILRFSLPTEARGNTEDRERLDSGS